MNKFWRNRTAGPVRAIHPEKKTIIEVNPQQDSKMRFELAIELKRHAPLLGWYMQLQNEAEECLRIARHEEHNAEEDLNIEIQEKLAKTATATTIKMKVKTHPRMRKAYRDRMAAETMFNQLKSAVDMIKAKGFALSNLTKLHLAERGISDSA